MTSVIQSLAPAGPHDDLELDNREIIDVKPVVSTPERRSVIDDSRGSGWFSPVKSVTKLLFRNNRKATEHIYSESQVLPTELIGNGGSSRANALEGVLPPTDPSHDIFSVAETPPIDTEDNMRGKDSLLMDGKDADEVGKEGEVLSLPIEMEMRKRKSLHTLEDSTGREKRYHEDEEPIQKRTKLSRIVKQAKAPINAPRNSRGEAVRAAVQKNVPTTRNRPVETNRDENMSAVAEVQPPEKRGRGRPKKALSKLPPPKEAVRSSPAVSLAKNITPGSRDESAAGGVISIEPSARTLRSGRRNKQTNTSPANDPVATTQLDEPGADNENLPVLHHPGSVRAVGSFKSRRPHVLQEKKQPVVPLGPGRDEDYSKDSPEDAVMSDTRRSLQDDSPLATLNHLVDPDHLQDLVSDLSRVGYTKNKEKWYRKATINTCTTKNGLRLQSSLKKLESSYVTSKLPNPMSDIDNLPVLIESVKKESRRILQELSDSLKLEAEESREKITPILVDAYFILIPRFMDVVRAGVEAHTTDSPMESLALEQLGDLLDSLYDLSRASVDLPSDYQPEAKPKGSYKIKQPIRRFLPKLVDVCNAFRAEISNREWEAEAAKRNKRREIIRLAEKEEMIKAQERKRDQIKELHKQQRAAFHAELANPVLSQHYHAASAKNVSEAVPRKRQKAYAQSSQHANAETHWSQRDQNFSYDDEEDSDDPFAEDQPVVERVKGLFPNNNNKDSHVPWSYDDKVNFTNIMMLERGKDRYEIAAERLGRSIEEIFVHAQNLQAAFDDCHKNLKFMESPQDDWTFDVWVQKA